MKHAFILNPVSGKKNIAQTLPQQIRAAAEQLGCEPEIAVTQYPGHGTALAEAWAREARDKGETLRLYACGGDGTLNELLPAAKGRPWVELASVPLGSGNDFVRNYGSREDFLDLPRLMAGTAQTIDLIHTDQGYAASICAAGLDAQVAYGIPKYRRLPLCGGSMAYYLSIAETLCGPKGQRLEVCVDGQSWQQDCLLVAICNGRWYGGGFAAAPEASLADGLLDVILVKTMGLLRIAKVLAQYKSGKHLENGQVRQELRDVVTFLRGREVQLRTLDERPIVVTRDGECAPLQQLHAQVEPGALRVVLPKGLEK